MSPGDLIEAVAFDALTGTPDGSGGVTQAWQEQFSTRAAFRYLRGGESVIAARLAGSQPVVVTIRAQDAARQITPEWRMRDTRRGTAYNIRAIIPSDDRKFLEITAESGVAV